MLDASKAAEAGKQKRNIFLWWRLDPDELHHQVVDYDTLGWRESARKVSVLCLLFSMIITVVIINVGMANNDAYFDVGLMAIFAVFMYRGHRWAFIAAMVLWTLEKLVGTFTGLGTGTWNAGSLVGNILWWCFYMRAFYKGFKVAQLRRNPLEIAPESVF